MKYYRDDDQRQTPGPVRIPCQGIVHSVGGSLPAVWGAVDKPEPRPRRPWSPRAPVPGGVGIGLGGHLLLISEMLLQLIRFVLVISLLRSHVETAADERIGINIVDDISVHSLHECVGRQSMQHR